MSAPASSSRFQRWILPGLAFKAAVIGGGYATGRELAEYFIPSGPQGGVMAIVVAMLAWSGLCALTFALDSDVRLGLVLSASGPETDPVAASFRLFRFLSGGDAECTRLIGGAGGCREKGNVIHFFGFPGIPRR